MKRLALAAPLFLTACLGITPFFEVDHDVPPPPQRATIGELGIRSIPGQSYTPPASELYTTALSVDWPAGGTEESFVFFGGDLAVEDIQRDTVDGFLHVRARLRSNVPFVMTAEYQIVFYDMGGEPLISDNMAPKGFVLDPFGAVTAWNGCRLPEAHTFRILVRASRS